VFLHYAISGLFGVSTFGVAAYVKPFGMPIEHRAGRDCALAHPISERLPDFGFRQAQGPLDVFDVFLGFILLFPFGQQIAHGPKEL
jgi:hypothetical protein